MTKRLDYASISPEGMKAMAGVHSYVGHCGLPKALIELVYLRASQINGCAYCVDLHTRALLKEGLTIEKLMLVSVWREAGALFDEREQAALAWSESVTRIAETGAPDADFVALSEHFTQKEVVDLTLAISLMNAYNRIAIGFRAPPAAAKSA
ncbi:MULTISPECIES: carboxymuconolactone decarboxylase family protein [Methylosinus]|uniref:Carboxymuconolactone decarboxylase family protein n=1 Tax=Methylosinus trichosporium (strain ATCC 35070 / NCIMB 11131 / UNIQEM 75 / OB3b) TaxID=595536 RepID=A0A2D2D5J3_METT3|nr:MULTISPECIES: carboxymuconolactone decarboxylase family protein [Methylosinus]ATQ70278.1 carboxymuconolactone decarboxylase family protein [Methylosinus trichosporium OB3b]OBS51866.1 alkylhydroperoxidase [Methylosinus sp. 3S-1]